MAKERDDDLFKDSTMTFGEHLEELRIALFKSLIALVIGFVLGLFIAKHVIHAIQSPLEKSLETYYMGLTQERLEGEIARSVARGDSPHSIDQWKGLIDAGLVYDTYYLEPSQVLAELRNTYPDALKDVELPTNPNGHVLSVNGPAIFIPADFTDPVALAKAIAEGKSGQASPAAQVWNSLGGNQQALIERLADANSVSTDDAIALAEALSRTLARTIYDETSFADVELSERLRRLAQNPSSLTYDEKARLNRQLLEAAFPDLIAKSYPDLARFFLWHRIDDDQRTKPQSLNMQEPFMLLIKVALISGAVIASPFIFYFIWMFVAAGLYPHEQKYVYIYLPFSLALFLSGVAVAFFFVFEPVLNFLLVFNKTLGIDPDPRATEWFNFVLFLPLGFGIAFQLPLVMLFLERIGIFSVAMYLEKWRIAVLVITVLSALLTPADPYSIFFLAVPLVILYFGGVLLCRLLPGVRRTSRTEE